MTRALMIAAPRSGSGKTTATLGLLRAFKRRGVDVVGLKSGPDYIDPAFHAAASGREGVNLNSWAMAPDLLAALAARAAGESALALCEASMGLFDGVPAESGRTGASADVAAALGMPVLLVIDVTGQAQSAAAIVKGCAAYDERLKVAGVIVNRVGSERHRRLVVEAIEAMGISVVGALPRNDTIALPERHLGLVQAGETDALEARLEAIADFIETHVDCGRVLALAGDLDLRLRPCGRPSRFGRRDSASRSRATPRSRSSIRISCKAGARPAPRSSHSRRSLTSLRLPIAICAGFRAAIRNCMPGSWPRPRAFALAYVASPRRVRCTANAGAIWRWAKASIDASGVVHAMAGLVGVETSFEKRRMTLGYREARIASNCALGTAGLILRGHEFHYATIVARGADDPFAYVRDVYGAPEAPSGSRRGWVTGSFFHVIAEG